MSAKSVTSVFVVALGATLAGCTERLTVPNFQNPTVASVAADPLTAVPLLATGVLRNDRGILPAYVLGVGILGREAYNYSAVTDLTAPWLTSDVNANTTVGAAAGGLWGGSYVTVRDAFITLEVIDAAGPVFTDSQRSAMKGLLHTEIALSLLYAINTRHTLGITVDVYDDPTKLAPFVSRDSAFTFIAALLDQAQTELAAGGTTFPFTLPSGFAGFTTPATFTKFNRGLAARVNAYRASLGTAGCRAARSATCYQLVLGALQSSFLDPAGSLATGAFHVYSAASGDVSNSNSNQANPNIVAHAKADSGIQKKADGGNDNRFTAKMIRLSSPKVPQYTGVPTNWDYSIYAVRTDPIAIIRNEELILLRAEARYFTGDATGALADINLVRTKAGGLGARASFTSDDDFLDELLYNRRLSLLFEGHRWIDMRRFGRLNQLTLDLPSHIVVQGLPLPQPECLSRANATQSLRGPGC
jgi:hypothetical protein